MTGVARVGCSGWSYREWRGRFYPESLPARRWFEHYASTFDTVELNTTFYRLPAAATVAAWAAAAPPGFLYAAKLGSFGTHRKKLLDPHGWMARHLERSAGFGETLGPTLVQLPPRWRVDEPRLGAFLDEIPAQQRWAVELRDRSWLSDGVLDLLRRHHVALCVHDLIEDHPFVLTTDWTYVRFHGPHATTRPYVGAYGGAALRRRVDEVAAALDDGADAYCYFNNDVEAAAVHDALTFRAALVAEDHRRDRLRPHRRTSPR